MARTTPEYVTRNGPLSKIEMTSIEELTIGGRPAAAIAKRLGRHPATVRWAQARLGLRVPTFPNRRDHQRGTTTVRVFNAEQDAYLEAQRVRGLNFRQIADTWNDRFGFPRSQHTLRMRCVQLANFHEKEA
jgi:hypothetical protein